ncbi:MAG: hypothetical protein AB7P03_16525 [Kofleriaceae bacterium]
MDQTLTALTTIDEVLRRERDCKLAASGVADVVHRAAPALSEAASIDRRTRANKQASAWAFEHYGRSIGPLLNGIMKHACMREPAFKAAVAELVGNS